MHIRPGDHKLLALLQQDARQSVSDLARRLGVSRTTAQQRLHRLEEGGVIRGYTVVLGDEYRESRILAHASIVTKPLLLSSSAAGSRYSNFNLRNRCVSPS